MAENQNTSSCSQQHSVTPEILKLEKNVGDHFEKIIMDWQKIQMHYKVERTELVNKEKFLQQFEAQLNERLSLDQIKAKETVLKLAQEHQGQIEKFQTRIRELQKQLAGKQKMELEIERLKGDLQEMKDKEDDDEEETMESILEAQTKNDELKEGRRELINAFTDHHVQGFIRVKLMGDLASQPFYNATKRKYSKLVAECKAVELHSMWEECLKDPNWDPFKVITLDDRYKKIIDEEDERLKGLKEEYGDEVFEAVTTALLEMNECNPSARLICPELWNFKAERKATLKEGIAYVVKQWKFYKKRK